jgi:K+-transporting ATPase ATPase A chain
MFEIFLMLVIPFSLPRAFGRIVGDNRQGYAIVGVMAGIFLASLVLVTWAEAAAGGTAPQLAGAAMEGKETRFGLFGSTLFGSTSTLTSTGAVNSMHDSYTALGGMMPMINMMLGEIAPGGVGSGLYGMLVIAVIAVFVGGLLIGRTPEYLGKKIGPREIKLASLYILVTPILVLVGTALSFAIPAVRADLESTSIWNPGIHGLSEVLYAFTSAANNNGSAFAGLTANTPWLNTALGVAMLLGRFVPIVLVLALAGSLAAQDKVPSTVGTLPTHRPQFAGLLAGVAVIITALTYFPVLTLGPLAEGLS